MQGYLRRVVKHIWFTKQSQAFAAWRETAAQRKRLRQLGSVAVQSYATRSAAQVGAMSVTKRATQVNTAGDSEMLCICPSLYLSPSPSRLGHNVHLNQEPILVSVALQVFVAWRSTAHRSAHTHHALTIAAARLRNSFAAKAFSSWKAAAQIRMELKVRLGATVHCWLQRRLHAAFWRWQEASRNRADMRGRMQVRGDASSWLLTHPARQGFAGACGQFQFSQSSAAAVTLLGSPTSTL